MAYEEYKTNVRALCKGRGVQNPIREEDLKIASIHFRPSGSDAIVEVKATDMNRAGRLFVESLLEGKSMVHLPFHHTNWEPRAELFFTPELWNDCGPEHRPLVYHLKHSFEIVKVDFK